MCKDSMESRHTQSVGKFLCVRRYACYRQGRDGGKQSVEVQG